MLKKITTITFTLLLSIIILYPVRSFSKNKVEYAIIKGQVSFEVDNPIKLGTVKYGDIETIATADVNEDGSFAFMVPIKQEGFYYIQLPTGERYLRKIRLYLSKGLNFTISIGKEDYELKGSKLGHNKLVQKWNKVVAKIKPYNQLGGPPTTYEDFFPFFEKEILPAVKSFSEKIKTDDPTFNKLMKLAVQADTEYGALHFLFMPRTKHPTKEQLIPYYDELLKENRTFTDADILKLGNGYRWMSVYGKFYNSEAFGVGSPGDGFFGYLKTKLKHVGQPELKEVFIRKNLKAINKTPSWFAYKKFMKSRYKYMTSSKSESFLQEFESKMRSEKGQLGYDFTYPNIDGKEVSFEDFRGSYVYIDIWATWCGPCLKEVPHLKELAEEFADENITFVSISIDEKGDKDKWKKMVEEKDLDWIQLFADKAWQSGIVKNYDIKGIPRFLLFDKEGNIIDNDAMRPSNPDLEEQFKTLLGKED